MKRVTVVELLVCVMAFATLATAQENPTAGPLMRAVLKDAGRLATRDLPSADAAVQTTAIQEWSRVTSLAPGTEILVEVRGFPPASRYFVLADESELLVLDLANPQLTREIRRALLVMASTHPEHFPLVYTGSRFVHDNVRVAPDGVFLADRKVAEIAEVVKRIPRPDIVVITTTLKRHGSLVGAVVGAGAGLLLGSVSALQFVYKDCGGSCSDERTLMTLSLVGFPIAGGVLGYHAVTRTTQNVIYRAQPIPDP